MDWLHKITTSLADRTGTDTPALDAATRKAVLDIARVASHSSGDRINAPLLCYVLGVLAGRGVALEQTVPIVEEAAADEA